MTVTSKTKWKWVRPLCWMAFLGLIGCQTPAEPTAERRDLAPTAAVVAAAPTEAATAVRPPDTPTPRPTAVATNTPTATATPAHTSTPIPTATHTPTPSETPTPIPTPTFTPYPLSACGERVPDDDDLLVVVTKEYGLSRDYQPQDLVPLEDYFGNDITLGYPSIIREIIAAPLVRLIDDMQAADLQPQIISGYRSYYSQQIAFDKWLEREPERAALLSAPPGHSEHQLGTTVDFGSPNLKDYIDNENLQFHTYFYKTPEGQWLLENAHRYGFTLSYPREAQPMTGFYYEPWHYRYVGVEMATFLYEADISLTEHQLLNNPEPCG